MGKNLDTSMDAFLKLGLSEPLVQALADMGYEEPTPIQSEAIPHLLNGVDLIGQAATGTGKTAAFSLPMLERLKGRGKSIRPAGLVLVPTRELAMQVAEAIHKYGKKQGIRALPIYGGQGYDPQIRGLKRGVDVVIATPGRALDHINRGTLQLEEVSIVVLDEADEMLDMGFVDDIETILAETPDERQTVLFSATLPPRIASITKKYLKNPTKIQIAKEKTTPGETPKVKQVAYIVARSQKLAALGRIIDVENPTSGIIFCRTRNEVDELTETLNARGLRTEPLHGGMSQMQRDRAIKKLKEGKSDLVIATDVAARGLDIDRLSHVINFDVPSAPESYVHRIGRVGRAGREGIAITLAEPREHRLLRNIEQITKQKINTAPVPSLADLRARRMQDTLDKMRQAVPEGEFEPFRPLVESLSAEFDLMDIAMAALKIIHAQQPGAEDGPEVFGSPQGPEGRERFRSGGDDRRPQQQGGSRGPRPQQRERPRPNGARIYINVGRADGARPQDILGAITGEADIPGKQIGSIEIFDRFSLVDVPKDATDHIIDCLNSAMIKGRKVRSRIDRENH